MSAARLTAMLAVVAGLACSGTAAAAEQPPLVAAGPGFEDGAAAWTFAGGGADGSGPLLPPRRLEGFTKVWLKPGQRRRVTVVLGQRAFAHWDSERDEWVQPAGTYTVAAGTSSRDLPLSERVHRDEATVP
jgi:hypothetical protein